MNNKHSNENKNTSNGQILHSIVVSNNSNVSHNQISAASATFNRAIGSRQSSPTDEVNNLGSAIQLHSSSGVSEKINSVNLPNVQNSVVQNSVTKEASLIPVTGPGASENQQGSASSAPTQQINIDTSGFPGQVICVY